MIDALQITTEGLDDLIGDVEKLTSSQRDIIADVINVATVEGHRLAIRKMKEEVNFPDDYLTGDRFAITQKATGLSLTSVIQARARGTSLSRFAISNSRFAIRKSKGATVEVKPGNSRYMRGTFMIDNLNSGRGAGNNRGLAIRLKPGETLRNKKIQNTKASKHPNWQGVYLLYGPSVYQAFVNVIDDIEQDVIEIMRQEYAKRVGQNNG